MAAPPPAVASARSSSRRRLVAAARRSPAVAVTSASASASASAPASCLCSLPPPPPPPPARFCWPLQSNKLTDNGSTTPAGLVAAALAHAFALFVAVSVGANISGGHVNPAVTFGAFLGGNITLLRGILYWIAQCLGSIVACLLLKFATGGLETSAFSLSTGVSVWNALVFEIVMTFGLVYTVYATAVDPKKGNVGIIAPIAIGFIVGANILAGGAFDGGSMNPAVSFGPAVVSWTWANHWVYWLGPLIGAAIAALVYDNIFIGDNAHEALPTADY